MPLDGSGGYTLPPVYNVSAGQDILDVQLKQPLEDIRDALGLALYRDGRAAMTGDLNMANRKVINLLPGVALTDAATVQQVSSNQFLRNRIINGAMQVSLERGVSTTDVTTGASYFVDQWRALLSTTPGGTLRGQQVGGLTPGGSSVRLRMTAQVADASIVAADLYSIQQPIEGLHVTDIRFGGVGAIQLVLRLGVRSSIAGTFGVSIANNALTRSWVGTIVIGAGEVNTDLLRTLVIPGDTLGVWATDNTVGLHVRLCLAAGADWHGATGWQGSNEYTTSAQTNFMATGGATFELFDVGLYVDPINIGTAPRYEVPAIDDELRRCRRYWEQVDFALSSAAVDAGGVLFGVVTYTEEKRVSPTLGSTVVSSTNATSTTTTAVGNTPNTRACGVTSSGVALGSPMSASGFVTANARF